MENKINFRLRAVSLVAKVFFVAFLIPGFLLLLFGIYRSGYFFGFQDGQVYMERYYLALVKQAGLEVADKSEVETEKDVVLITPAPTRRVSAVVPNWGGPQLWEAVNKRRKELGVNPLSSRDELCTIASIRLNELLELGKLDNHEGFSNVPERRSDLKWVFEKYSTLAEFLAMGGTTAEETVSLWENTLGHKKLLTGGEYVWGCIYAQNTFAVAITAF